VLSVDPWETIALTANDGLAAILHLEPGMVEHAGRKLWPQYSLTSELSEDGYLNDFSQLVGTEVSRPLVEEIKARLLSIPCLC
jgi:hypothetical protein